MTTSTYLVDNLVLICQLPSSNGVLLDFGFVSPGLEMLA